MLSLGSVVFILTVFFIVSCSSNGVVDRTISQNAMCDQVGADHNLIMDQMFDEIFRQMPSSRSNVTDPFLPIDPIGPNDPIKPIFIDYKIFDCIDLLTIPESEKVEIKKTISQVHADCLSGKIDTTAVFEPTNQYLTHKARLESIIKNDNYDLNSLCQQIDAVKQSAEDIEDDVERQAILMGASVAQNSLRYWHDNIDRICDSLGFVLPPNIGSDPIISSSSIHYPQTRGWLGYNWKQAGVADLAGGLAAGTGKFCGACKFLGPAGWKAVAIATAGGAAFASLSDLICQYGASGGYSVSIVSPLVDYAYDATLYELRKDFLVGSIVISPVTSDN